MAEARPAPLPFDEAIRFLRQKVRLPTRTWTDLWQGMHARAFVVAGATKAGLIEDFHNAVDRALAEGRTLADFRKDFDRIVAAHGWSYKGSRGWRSAVILNTNLRTAYAAGKWQQAQRLKASRPYLRYVAVLDDRTRPEHRAWHGTVLPADDDWWKTHFPPNGWNCRCTVQQLSDRDLDRFGYEVSDQAPTVETETREVNTPDGKVAVRVPKGIDTGFAYNVGEAAWGRGEELARLERHGRFEDLFAPGGSRPADPGRLPVERTRTQPGPRGRTEKNLRAALRSAIGGDSAVFTDPTGERVAVGQAVVDHMLEEARRRDGRELFFPFMSELIEAPAEIWVGFHREASGRVAIRRRYLKQLRIDKDRVLALVADVDGGQWSGLTFYRGETTALNRLRSGLRIFKSGE